MEGGCSGSSLTLESQSELLAKTGLSPTVAPGELASVLPCGGEGPANSEDPGGAVPTATDAVQTLRALQSCPSRTHGMMR